ncbi:hybrid sensor histidine kinase/response regulator [Aquabacterium soli]|uniref:histidine kinase n=1 Tax=Aquabacterium soli TaxID=2493092 RepID=A0A426V8A6_9BURK|nr:ATP-binding protein [Aquabacterium soli]RRS02958.1 hybrid sensor histidine kinase/response regulator [Aquabacterium soli]
MVAPGHQPLLTPPRPAEHEVLGLVARHVSRIPFPVFLAALLIAVMASRTHATAPVAAWLALTTLVLVLRWVLLRRPPAPTESARPAMRRAVVLSGLNGVAHALSLLFFPGMGDLERAVLTMLLTGLSSAAVGSTCGHPRIYPAYAVPVMVALAVAWGFTPEPAGPDARGWLGPSMGVLIMLYLAVLLSLARDNHRALTQAVDLRRREFKLNEELRQALTLAEQANAAKTRFLASASHDLRQPLHTLSLFSASLTTNELSPRGQAIVNHMNTALKALGEQLSGLLDLSRLDAGIIDSRSRTIALAPLLTQLHQACAPVAEAKGLRLVLACDDDLLAAHTDEAHLARIVRNLLDNALKYCDAGTVWIRAGWRGGRALVSIKDTGRGIPAEHHARVFEEFFQLNNPERDRSKGLGLGLSIVQRLSQLLGIELGLVSEPGVGTEVSLLLPAPQGALPTATEDATSTAAAMPSCHMLVIDDEADVRTAMEVLLTSLGCRVTVCACTDDAMRLAAADPPDIVLADLRLRGEQSGIKAIRKLRQQQPGLPALLISGDTAPDRLKEARAEGLVLLHKPVAVDTLLAAIQQALEADEDTPAA